VTVLATLLALAPVGATVANAQPVKPDPVWKTTPVGQEHLILVDVQAHGAAMFAIGQAEDPRSGQLPAVLRKDGGKWVRLPDPDATDYRLNGLAVGGPNDVWVTGIGNADQYETTPLLLHWNGHTWTEVKGPAVPNGQFGDIKIAPDGALWIAGWARIGDREPGVVYRYAGGKWQPLTAGLEDSVNGNVLTVFSNTDAWLGLNAGLAHWDGKTWTLVKEVPTDGSIIPTAMVDQGRKNIWLTGVQHSSTGDHPLVMRYDGTRWTTVKVPAISGQLYDIALWKGRPIVVGERFVDDGNRFYNYPLALRYDGSKFVTTTVPTPATTEGTLTSLLATPTKLWTAGYTSTPSNPGYTPLAAFTK
jgi:hypothetical protein